MNYFPIWDQRENEPQKRGVCKKRPGVSCSIHLAVCPRRVGLQPVEKQEVLFPRRPSCFFWASHPLCPSLPNLYYPPTDPCCFLALSLKNPGLSPSQLLTSDSVTTRGEGCSHKFRIAEQVTPVPLSPVGAPGSLGRNYHGC